MGRIILIRRYPVLVPTTWNPSDKDASITLSGGNLTAACSLAGQGAVRSIAGVTQGKWYWELTVQTANAREEVGVITSAGAINTFLGNNAAGYAYFSFDGNKYNNSAGAAYGAAYGNTNVISVLLDMDAKTLTFWKNGVSQGQAFSGLSGTMHAAFSGGSGSFTEQVTANFGASAFAHTPPAGYQRGFGPLI